MRDELTRTPGFLRILLADDATDIRFLIAAYLKHLGCRIDFAQNGKIGMEKFIKSGGYDLVIMDMQMPVMDGYIATRRIRAWEADNRARRVPILALTACPFEQEIRRALEAGCDGYLAKPVRKATLIAAIEETLALGAESGKSRSSAARA